MINLNKADIKRWVDATVWGGEDRTGFTYFRPDEMQEIFDKCFECLIQPELDRLEAKCDLLTQGQVKLIDALHEAGIDYNDVLGKKV